MLIFIVIVLFFSIIEVWIKYTSQTATKNVQPAIESVARAYLWSKVTGSYWENEMGDQYNNIKTYSQSNRLEFFMAILLNFKLDTSKSVVFAEIVSSDAQALRQKLIVVSQTREFQKLSKIQKKIVISWITELKYI